MNQKNHHFIIQKLVPELQEIINDLGYVNLTEIQEKSIPVLLEGKDLVGQSKTGSGKTASFTLPILQNLSKTRQNLQRDSQIHALILCPTRELCAQVAREIQKLGKKLIGLQVVTLAGGQPIGPQMRLLEVGSHIVVGTPGRVLDHLTKNSLKLQTLKTLVLDEADRMCDMGFEEEMLEILNHVPKKRQTILFSATFPKNIEKISQTYQNNAVRVTVQNTEQVSQIHESYVEVETSNDDQIFNEKLNATLKVLTHFNPSSTIIFCNFKTSVAELTESLIKNKVAAVQLHGDLEQTVRDDTMAKFRNESARVLVATDVAARGLDIPNLDLVINFEIAKTKDTHTHRIGRTGRAGKSGQAVTIALVREKTKLSEANQALVFDPKQNQLKQFSKYDTLWISGGRKNKIRPGDLLGALTGDAGALPGTDIGKIEIHDFCSYVAIDKGSSKKALYRLRDGKIKGRRFRVELV